MKNNIRTNIYNNKKRTESREHKKKSFLTYYCIPHQALTLYYTTKNGKINIFGVSYAVNTVCRVICMSPYNALQSIKQLDKLFLTATEVAPVIGCNPNDIRGQARDRPELLGFPVTIYGSRVKIPRLPFIQYIETLPCCQRQKQNTDFSTSLVNQVELADK